MARDARGYNLWTYRDYVLYHIESRMNSAASADLSEPLIYRFLNEAHKEACRRAQFRRSSEIPIDSVSGQVSYNIPNQVLHDRVIQARYLLEGTWRPLSFITPESFYALHPSTEKSDGIVRHFSLHPESRTLMFGPAPLVSGVGAIRIVAETIPDDLTRVYQSIAGGITATVANGGTTVTLSGSAPTLAVEPGDEIGFIPSAQSDGSSLIQSTPTSWYKVQAVTDPIASLTLSDVYYGPALSGVHFVTAQVPNLEYAYPGMFGFAIAQLAAGNILLTRSPEVSDRLRADALAVFDGITDTTFRARAPRPQNSALMRLIVEGRR